MKLRSISIAVASALVLGISATSFGATMNILGQTDWKLMTPADADSLFPYELNLETHEFRITGSERNAWTFNLYAVGSAKKGAITWARPQFYAQLFALPRTFQIWGGGYDLGAVQKADPNQLILVGGTNGIENVLDAWDNGDSAPPAGDMNIRTTWDIASVPVTTDIHQDASGQTNLTAFGEKTIGNVKYGGALRLGFRGGNQSGSHTAVGFAEADLAGVKVGVSLANRFAEGVDDAMAYGVTVTKDFAVGASKIEAKYIGRQDNYYDPNTIDASYQSGAELFRNIYTNAQKFPNQSTAASQVFQLTATWRGLQNAKLNEWTMFNATDFNAFTSLKEPAYQALLRISNDSSDNNETILIGRAGTAFIPDTFWGIVEAKAIYDKDGVYNTAANGNKSATIGGVAGTSRTQVRGQLRYSLNNFGWNNWFLLGTGNFQRMADDADNVGTSLTLKGEVWYNAGKVRIINGLSSTKESNKDKANTQLYHEFRVLF